MFKLFKKRKPEQQEQDAKQLDTGLQRTRRNFSDGLADAMFGKKTVDNELLEDIETQLLAADVGIDTTQIIMDELQSNISRKHVSNPDALMLLLQEIMADMLKPCEQPLMMDESDKPFVLLMVGINGAGKTTTIGKLAKRLQQDGKSVMLAAGDTFRAAAVEQLQVWGERNDIPVVAQQTGADTAAVIFDAMQSAQAKGTDVLIADTAGRLHTQDNLMAELEKVIRVIKKVDDTAPHEVMIVLDSSLGQNALQQVKEFRDAVNVSGITLTKLDGTAKGGIVFALAKQTGLPIRFIGVGEGIDDLQEFESTNFVKALFN
tara:strand:+ start:89670 stop:90623 length:954 start_codon:yes stop_codon:yes gene_type:complete